MAVEVTNERGWQRQLLFINVFMCIYTYLFICPSIDPFPTPLTHTGEALFAFPGDSQPREHDYGAS